MAMFMNDRMKVTLDTNCIIVLFDQSIGSSDQKDIIQEIVKLGTSGKIEIVITTQVPSDIENDKNVERRNQTLSYLPIFEVIGYPSDNSESLYDEIQKILFPRGLDRQSSHYDNKDKDIKHLVAHHLHMRDIFITNDNDILKNCDNLQRSPGIKVMKPDQFLKFFESIEEGKMKRPLESQKSIPGYHSSGFSGKVTFDYSNNNGIYVIGEGLFLFETRWTKASDLSIYSYNDYPSIDSIALVKDCGEISEISNAERYDYTSRCRTVNEGQILLIKNKNGFFAAIKVLDIKDDSRDDEIDELTFEYYIQTNGTKSFSISKN